ncbi:ribulokinase [Parenemella sanctibonifatiensis]|uniref:Ribulokinase n=1 Tax=Parenemella sanctibonifatiensis TaxID=2016505 RepID=A0A255EKK2_9ACTN|nr:ribulokinase [Parenemella sanctibonifatiensis]OYN89982.1 ribulokinase [Parenemella sanctibonifatiensis]
MSEKFVIGIDFGTLSGRAAVVSTADGSEHGPGAITEFRHQIMDHRLDAGDGQQLPPDFALQVPQDYIEVLQTAVPEAVKASGVAAEDIVGIGIDFTSSTVVAAKADGTPVCELDEFKNRPHAYVKLWKHHGAEEQARRIVEVAEQRNEAWLPRYGGTLSSEMLLPKALETFEVDREVYDATEEFVDALDWIVWRMTGSLVYSAGDSGYKRMYQDGAYPTEDFLEAVAPGFGKVYTEKMAHDVQPLGSKAGELTEEAAGWMGLQPGIAVAVGNIDAHVTAAAVQAVEPGQLTAIMGTSACYVVSNDELREVPGMFGVVDGGIVEGAWGFEAGQTGMGDVYAWFVDNLVPTSYHEEAAEKGVSLHALLTTKGAEREVGEHGLIAIDWHNGNRSILVDNDLSGLFLGLSLATRAEDMYRSLLEATSFGLRIILESFEEAGVEVSEIVMAGGLLKNTWLMQLMCDVINKPLSVATTEQGGALGSAVHAAVAAGVYGSVAEGSRAMGGKEKDAYLPDQARHEAYDELFAEYRTLHDYFGRGENEVMHVLKRIRRRAAAKRKA